MNENQVNGWPDRQKLFGGEWIKKPFAGNNFGGE